MNPLILTLLLQTLPNGTIVDLNGCTVSNLQTGKTSFLRCLLKVVATPTPSPTPIPTPTPTPLPSNIPDLALFESHAKTYGQKACDYLNTTGHTYDEYLAATYYDSQRVLLNLAAYFPTEAAKWNNCAELGESVYQDYVDRNNGTVPGYWNFSTGLRMDFEQNNDSASKNSVHLLAMNASYCNDATPLEWTNDVARSREAAYCVLAMINDEKLGSPHRARLDQMLTQILGHANQWLTGTAIAVTPFDGNQACLGKNYIQPFMIGLTLQSLIAYQEWKPDSRLPSAIKNLVDYLRTRVGVDVNSNFFYENCSDSPTGPWLLPITGTADLNLLIVPAYAYLYKTTGQGIYLTDGDKIWSGGVKGAYLEQNKQFNQNYAWSFDYIKWRSGN